MKKISVSILVAVVALVAFYKWDSAKNRGFTFGYYGELNTVTRAASDLPDVASVRVAAANIDIGLEEFSIEVAMNDGRHTMLSFLESDSLRSQSGSELSQGLAALLSSQLSVGR